MALSRKAKGNWGEDIALEYLVDKGYKLVLRNYRYSRSGEIDLIVKTPDEKILVFVEVKAGETDRFGPLEYRITPAKQKTIYKIAEIFLQKYEIKDLDIRFDAVFIKGNKNKYTIQHWENAF